MSVTAGVRSLGWRTDLALLAQSGSTLERRDDGVVVVRTPDNPAFHWGNFLLLPRAPDDDRTARAAVTLFEALFADTAHRAIGLDSPGGVPDDLAPLVGTGLAADVSTVLTTHRVSPPATAPGAVVLRRLTTDDDWTQRAALPPAIYPSESADQPRFVALRSAGERRRCEAGHGHWWGAFEDGLLLSALGLFDAGGGLARYQDVETRPDAERRGLAGALLHAAARHATATWGAHTFVIVADPDYGAIRLYRRLGFVDAEVQLAVSRSSAPPGA